MRYSPIEPSAGVLSAAKQTLRRAARSLTGSRSTWHFMAWSFVISEAVSRDWDHGKAGYAGLGGGEVDLSADHSRGDAGPAPDAHGDAVMIVSDGDGFLGGAGGGQLLLKALDVHFEHGFVNIASFGFQAAAFGQQGGDGFTVFSGGGGGGGNSSAAVGAGATYTQSQVTVHDQGFNGPGTGNHDGGLGGGAGVGVGGGIGAGGIGGGVGAGGIGGGGILVLRPYDGPAITITDGVTPFATKLGLGTTGDGISAAALPETQSSVKGALDFAANPLAPLGVTSTTGLHHGDTVNMHYIIQESGYGSTGSAQLQFTNLPTDPASTLQTTSFDTKTSSNTAVLNDQVAASPSDALFVKGNYYEYNTIVQVNITANNDSVLMTRTGDGQANAPSLINTGDNQQQNSAHITDVLPGSGNTIGSGTSSGTGSGSGTGTSGSGTSGTGSGTGSTGNSGAALDPSAPGPSQASLPPVETGPHHVVLGAISQHDTVVQISQISAADTLQFNFNDVLGGNVNAGKFPGFADVHAGGDVQTNSSDVSFNAPISQIGYSAKDFIKAHTASHTTSISGDYYKVNTIFQLNVIQDSNSIAKTVGDAMASASLPATSGTGSSAPGGGVLASGGNIALNAASIVHHDHSGDLFVGGKYTQYNLVLQINALSDNSSVTQSSAVHHDGTHPGDPMASTGDMHHGSGNGADGGSTQFALADPLHELALRGGQTADHMM